ncbi:hypothetical protein TVAG_142490 [Trichomonas vaginalis G3]|uniref:Uncharacterized protein n=1 Tax=Trichomonas vaginalis (strain ATCC PRA-98 / G3) TaxID=412133 RepID=A2EHK8_TRIV3|nr:hypothetical protein TVAGG3_0775670 [Trichomonas vaginalis G3]EAY07895.1 hypothetical protein TVAG_142490 [Trichomonas vaginalis G3]KAI5514154.1 hypothetical protein TVAGG3_0775670 [Trichomonas vaginalis G3]|eukprot:XP_001320118.1 hypothetical protein [Trichomonas vaginalis G3]
MYQDVEVVDEFCFKNYNNFDEIHELKQHNPEIDDDHSSEVYDPDIQKNNFQIFQEIFKDFSNFNNFDHSDVCLTNDMPNMQEIEYDFHELTPVNNKETKKEEEEEEEEIETVTPQKVQCLTSNVFQEPNNIEKDEFINEEEVFSSVPRNDISMIFETCGLELKLTPQSVFIAISEDFELHDSSNYGNNDVFNPKSKEIISNPQCYDERNNFFPNYNNFNSETYNFENIIGTNIDNSSKEQISSTEINDQSNDFNALDSSFTDKILVSSMMNDENTDPNINKLPENIMNNYETFQQSKSNEFKVLNDVYSESKDINETFSIFDSKRIFDEAENPQIYKQEEIFIKERDLINNVQEETKQIQIQQNDKDEYITEIIVDGKQDYLNETGLNKEANQIESVKFVIKELFNAKDANNEIKDNFTEIGPITSNNELILFSHINIEETNAVNSLKFNKEKVNQIVDENVYRNCNQMNKQIDAKELPDVYSVDFAKENGLKSDNLFIFIAIDSDCEIKELKRVTKSNDNRDVNKIDFKEIEEQSMSQSESLDTKQTEFNPQSIDFMFDEFKFDEESTEIGKSDEIDFVYIACDTNEEIIELPDVYSLEKDAFTLIAVETKIDIKDVSSFTKYKFDEEIRDNSSNNLIANENEIDEKQSNKKQKEKNRITSREISFNEEEETSENYQEDVYYNKLLTDDINELKDLCSFNQREIELADEIGEIFYPVIVNESMNDIKELNDVISDIQNVVHDDSEENKFYPFICNETNYGIKELPDVYLLNQSKDEIKSEKISFVSDDFKNIKENINDSEEDIFYPFIANETNDEIKELPDISSLKHAMIEFESEEISFVSSDLKNIKEITENGQSIIYPFIANETNNEIKELPDVYSLKQTMIDVNSEEFSLTSEQLEETNSDSQLENEITQQIINNDINFGGEVIYPFIASGTNDEIKELQPISIDTNEEDFKELPDVYSMSHVINADSNQIYPFICTDSNNEINELTDVNSTKERNIDLIEKINQEKSFICSETNNEIKELPDTSSLNNKNLNVDDIKELEDIYSVRQRDIDISEDETEIKLLNDEINQKEDPFYPCIATDSNNEIKELNDVTSDEQRNIDLIGMNQEEDPFYPFVANESNNQVKELEDVYSIKERNIDITEDNGKIYPFISSESDKDIKELQNVNSIKERNLDIDEIGIISPFISNEANEEIKELKDVYSEKQKDLELIEDKIDFNNEEDKINPFISSDSNSKIIELKDSYPLIQNENQNDINNLGDSLSPFISSDSNNEIKELKDPTSIKQQNIEIIEDGKFNNEVFNDINNEEDSLYPFIDTDSNNEIKELKDPNSIKQRDFEIIEDGNFNDEILNDINNEEDLLYPFISSDSNKEVKELKDVYSMKQRDLEIIEENKFNEQFNDVKIQDNSFYPFISTDSNIKIMELNDPNSMKQSNIELLEDNINKFGNETFDELNNEKDSLYPFVSSESNQEVKELGDVYSIKQRDLDIIEDSKINDMILSDINNEKDSLYPFISNEVKELKDVYSIDQCQNDIIENDLIHSFISNDSNGSFKVLQDVSSRNNDIKDEGNFVYQDNQEIKELEDIYSSNVIQADLIDNTEINNYQNEEVFNENIKNIHPFISSDSNCIITELVYSKDESKIVESESENEDLVVENQEKEQKADDYNVTYDEFIELSDVYSHNYINQMNMVVDENKYCFIACDSTENIQCFNDFNLTSETNDLINETGNVIEMKFDPDEDSFVLKNNNMNDDNNLTVLSDIHSILLISNLSKNYSNENFKDLNDSDLNHKDSYEKSQDLNESDLNHKDSYEKFQDLNESDLNHNDSNENIKELNELRLFEKDLSENIKEFDEIKLVERDPYENIKEFSDSTTKSIDSFEKFKDLNESGLIHNDSNEIIKELENIPSKNDSNERIKEFNDFCFIASDSFGDINDKAVNHGLIDEETKRCIKELKDEFSHGLMNQIIKDNSALMHLETENNFNNEINQNQIKISENVTEDFPIVFIASKNTIFHEISSENNTISFDNSESMKLFNLISEQKEIRDNDNSNVLQADETFSEVHGLSDSITDNYINLLSKYSLDNIPQTEIIDESLFTGSNNAMNISNNDSIIVENMGINSNEDDTSFVDEALHNSVLKNEENDSFFVDNSNIKMEIDSSIVDNCTNINYKQDDSTFVDYMRINCKEDDKSFVDDTIKNSGIVVDEKDSSIIDQFKDVSIPSNEIEENAIKETSIYVKEEAFVDNYNITFIEENSSLIDNCNLIFNDEQMRNDSDFNQVSTVQFDKLSFIYQEEEFAFTDSCDLFKNSRDNSVFCLNTNQANNQIISCNQTFTEFAENNDNIIENNLIDRCDIINNEQICLSVNETIELQSTDIQIENEEISNELLNTIDKDNDVIDNSTINLQNNDVISFNNDLAVTNDATNEFELNPTVNNEVIEQDEDMIGLILDNIEMSKDSCKLDAIDDENIIESQITASKKKRRIIKKENKEPPIIDQPKKKIRRRKAPSIHETPKSKVPTPNLDDISISAKEPPLLPMTHVISSKATAPDLKTPTSFSAKKEAPELSQTPSSGKFSAPKIESKRIRILKPAPQLAMAPIFNQSSAPALDVPLKRKRHI